jgi:hypothetical protein
MSYIPQLLASLERRLDEVATEIRALESARAALDGETPRSAPAAVARRTRQRPSARRTRATPVPKPTPTAADRTAETSPPAAEPDVKPRARASRPRPAAKGPRAKRATVALEPHALERLLADTTAGLSAGAVAERAGAGYNPTLKLLRELEAAGQVRREGVRRSTRWRLITDEERIAVRAAELEGQTRERRTDPSRRRGRARAS